MEKNNKIKKFIEAYGELVKKHGVDFAQYPMWIPDEKGGFRLIIQNTPVDLDEAKKGGFIKWN